MQDQKYAPRIIEFKNDVTGETKWTVYRRGYAPVGLLFRKPFSRDFDTRAEAVDCFAEEFGWVEVQTFQPDDSDRPILYEESRPEPPDPVRRGK